MFAAILLAFLCGAGFHAVLVAVAIAMWRDRNLPDIRPAMSRRAFVPPSSVGVVVRPARPPLGDPPSFDPFREEKTR